MELAAHPRPDPPVRLRASERQRTLAAVGHLQGVRAALADAGVTRRVLLLAVALVLLVGCSHQRSATAPTTTPPAGLPKVTVTPGVVLTTSTADICTPGWASKHRHGLTAKQKTVVLRAYGYPPGTKVAEWDHYLSLELGGGNGPSNIWPMINRVDSQRKDRLEGRLHDAVCAGRQTLSEAQARIRQYWLWW